MLDREKLLLSIQGGGIRGIIPCLALKKLEEHTQKLTREIFGWIGGTSTGALLTAAIAAGIPAYKSLEVYVKSGPEIFSPLSDEGRKLNLLIRGRQFDSNIIHRVLTRTLDTAMAMRINDSPVNVMITAGDMLGVAWYFVKDADTNSKKTGRALLLDTAVASACAATYHDPWLIPGFGYFSDGGMVSLADPVYQLCVEAFKGYKCYGSVEPSSARVVSLGTGFYAPESVPDPPDSLLENIKFVTSSEVGSSKTIAQECVERHWPGVLRAFNPQLMQDTDESSVDSIPALLSTGQAAADAIDWDRVLS